MIMGVMICPSKVVTTIQIIGATNASVRTRKAQEANYKERGHYYRWTEVGNETQRACEHPQRSGLGNPTAEASPIARAARQRLTTTRVPKYWLTFFSASSRILRATWPALSPEKR